MLSPRSRRVSRSSCPVAARVARARSDPWSTGRVRVPTRIACPTALTVESRQAARRERQAARRERQAARRERQAARLSSPGTLRAAVDRSA